VVQTDLILSVLLSDESNPRAVAFQLATLFHQVGRLQDIADDGEGKERELAYKALSAVREANVADLALRAPDGRFAALDELITEVRWILYAISDTLTATYLSHQTASRLTASS